MASELIVANSWDVQRLVKVIQSIDLRKPMVFCWKQHRESRSLSANALQHVWYAEIARDLQRRGSTTDKEEVKEILKYNFLGTEIKEITDFKTGKVVEVETIKRTRDLDRAEACHYMNQIEAWAMGFGIVLEAPEKSEYWKWAQEQVQ